MTFERREEYDPRRSKDVKEYRVTPPPIDDGGHGRNGEKTADKQNVLPFETGAESAVSAHAEAISAHTPPIEPPMKPLIPPIPPMTHLTGQSFDQVEDNSTPYIPTMEPHGRMGGKSVSASTTIRGEYMEGDAEDFIEEMKREAIPQ